MFHRSIFNERDLIFTHPTFLDFAAAENNPRCLFPYRCALFPGNHSDLVAKVLKPRGFLRIHSKEDDPIETYSFIWKPTQFSSKFYARADQVNATREAKTNIILNHLENIKVIGTKTGILRCLRRYYKTVSEAVAGRYSVSDSLPTSFIVMGNSAEAEFGAFVQRFKELERGLTGKERMPAKHCDQNVWLIKPAAMNQGKGIEIFNNNLEEMRTFLFSRPSSTFWVIQKYIEKPLLFKGRKFDIRIWALMTWKNELYIYKNGYLRTSSDEYTLESKYNYWVIK